MCHHKHQAHLQPVVMPTVVRCCCSAETEYKEERVPLAVKTCKFMKGRESLEHRAALEEVHALKMAKGKAHIIQEVRAKFHDVTTNGARIVTRSVIPCHVSSWDTTAAV